MKKFILILYMIYLPFRLKIPQLPIVPIVDFFNIILLAYLIAGRNEQALKSRFETPLFLFLIIWSLSFLYAVFQTIQYWGLPVSDITREFKRLFTLPLGYFVFARCLKTRKEAKFFFNVFLICVAVIGFYTFQTGMLEGPSFADHKRGFGPFGASWRNSDIAGGFLAMFSPFLFSYFLFTKRKALKLMCACGLIACLTGVLTTYSRGSLIALIVGCAMVALFSLKHLLRHSKILIVFICIIACLGILKWRHWMPQSIITRIDETIIDEHDRVGGIDISDLDSGSQGRIEMWKSSLEFFYAHPIIGAGFQQVQFYSKHDPHNAFILIAAEMGILGLLAFLWLLWRIFKEAKTLIGTEFTIIGSGFMGCVIALIIVNMFYSNFFRDNVVGSFWIMLGILTACKGFVAQEASNNNAKK